MASFLNASRPLICWAPSHGNISILEFMHSRRILTNIKKSSFLLASFPPPAYDTVAPSPCILSLCPHNTSNISKMPSPPLPPSTRRRPNDQNGLQSKHLSLQSSHGIPPPKRRALRSTPTVRRNASQKYNFHKQFDLRLCEIWEPKRRTPVVRPDDRPEHGELDDLNWRICAVQTDP